MKACLIQLDCITSHDIKSFFTPHANSPTTGQWHPLIELNSFVGIEKIIKNEIGHYFVM